MITKLAKDIEVGDHIQLDDGIMAKVREVTKGFVRFENDSSMLITHEYGWSQVPSRLEITVEADDNRSAK